MRRGKTDIAVTEPQNSYAQKLQERGYTVQAHFDGTAAEVGGQSHYVTVHKSDGTQVSGKISLLDQRGNWGWHGPASMETMQWRIDNAIAAHLRDPAVVGFLAEMEKPDEVAF